MRTTALLLTALGLVGCTSHGVACRTTSADSECVARIAAVEAKVDEVLRNQSAGRMSVERESAWLRAKIAEVEAKDAEWAREVLGALRRIEDMLRGDSD